MNYNGIDEGNHQQNGYIECHVQQNAVQQTTGMRP
jgi:hypothetical protein